MRNLYLLPTNKPSRLYKDGEKLKLDIDSYGVNNQNIYITSDEKIKEGDCCYDSKHNIVFKCDAITPYRVCKDNSKHVSLLDDNLKRAFEIEDCNKIIITTDEDLITGGVQAIDDIFLEWFVKNPTCQYADVIKESVGSYWLGTPKERACTQDVIDAATRQASKEVRPPKIVRDGIINLKEKAPKKSYDKDYFEGELAKWGYNKGNSVDVEILTSEILPSLFKQFNKK